MKGEKHVEGQILWPAVEFIELHLPICFAMEQVNLMNKFKILVKLLKRLVKIKVYEVETRSLKASEIAGIPSRRNRLFLWGILRLVSTGLVVPQPIGFQIRLEDILDMQDIGCLKDTLPNDAVGGPNIVAAYAMADDDAFARLHIFDVYGTLPHVYAGLFPTITATRGGGRGYYLSSLFRFTKIKELARLQGFPARRVRWLGKVSRRQMGMMIGNSVCVPVAEAVVKSCLSAIN